MTNKKKIDIVAMQDELIRTFGWTVAAVFPDEDADEPGFTYTIGLAEKGLPELIVFALPPGAAQAILNDIAGQMVKGRKFPLDTPLDEILRGSKAMLVEADRLQTDGYMYGARRRFEGYRAWQLLRGTTRSASAGSSRS
jgi:hypothetical protein